MPNLLDRPYGGNFQPNARRVVKHTPDALIYLNGDIAIPGCPKCNGRIDIQRFVKSISVEAGTNAGAASGSAQLSVPVIFGEQMFREGKSLIQPAMEVHVYMRGFFPVRGQFAHLDTEAAIGLTGIEKGNFDRFTTYPYYHVFHGVITQVSWDYSDGFYSASINFASMLHFWQHHNIATNAALVGVKPEGTNAQPNLWGNIYTNMHPYAIIYDLYRSIIGAPGGIETTYNYQTNADAIITTRDGQNRSVYSMMQLYWEERFRTSIQNLRMYGVNGRLYNAAQQAYIGRRNSAKLNKLLQHNQHLDIDAQSNVKDPFSQTSFALAKSLGLGGAGLDITFAPSLGTKGASDPDEPLSLSMTSIFAFTLAPQSANLQNFESTYMTKLDIANQVCEATGFEFYQDVDGDLVFKPPFYNLDTSPSRVYRLEDIDIISASFSEKEPAATYCTVKAGVMTSLTLNHPEYTGNRGTFIDWRLVCKYGWRPANLEVSYYSNPKSLFFVAQHRLDILNIDVHSAQVTIPIRPELRPGYPVYIPFVDCYYYVTALSHQFSFGAQCTTSLTLTGRRAKFFAPGLPGKLSPGENAIERIRLDKPWLPERPLEIMDNGVPRWAGFPNVVMALDPLKPHPKWFAIRSGLEDFGTQIVGEGDVEMLFNIINQQVKTTGEGAGIFALASPEEDDPSSPTEHTRYVLKRSNNPEDDIEFSLADLREDYASFDAARTEIQRRRGQVAELRDQLRWLGSGDKRGIAQGGILARNETSTDAVQARLNEATKSLRLATESLAAGRTDFAAFMGGKTTFALRGSETNALALIVQSLQNNDVVRRSFGGIPDAPTTMAWLEILSDLKANMSPGMSLPGYYRYYSASHPNPDMQGQASLIFTEGTVINPFVSRENLSEPEETQGAEVETGPTPFRKGMFVRGLTGTGSVENMKQRIVEAGINWICVQRLWQYDSPERDVYTNGNAWRDYERAWKETGCELWIWGWPVPGREEEFAQEMGRTQREWGAVGIIIDCEKPWLGRGAQVPVLLEKMMALGVPIGLTSYGQPSYHPRFPYAEFSGVNFGVPQVYDRNNSLDKEYPRRAIQEWLDLGYSSVIPASTSSKKTPEQMREILARTPTPSNDIMWWDWYWTNLGNRWEVVKEYPNFLDQTGDKTQNQLDAPRGSSVFGDATSQGQNPSRIEIAPVNLESGQKVQGFVNGVLPLGSRPVEAELGDVSPTRGIKVLADNSGALKVVDTSQIQRLTFTRSEVNKSIAVEGLANEQGIYGPKEFETFLTKNLTRRFQGEGEPNIVGLESTPADFLQESYDQIRDALLIGVGADPREDPSAQSYPLYGRIDDQVSSAENQWFVVDFEVVRLPTFEEAASTNEIVTVDPYDTSIDFEEISEGRSAANLTLQELGKVPPFQGSTLDVIVKKVIAAYVNTVVSTIVGDFVVARDSAGFVEGKRPFGFTDRMASITDAFNSIALTTTLVEFDIRSQRSETRAYRAAMRNHGVFTPVFPVSDGGGYEHIGAFRYGRGLTVDPGGNFETINTSDDPFLNVSAETAEDFINALSSIQGVRPPKEGETAKNQREAALAAEVRRLSEEQRRVAEQVIQGTSDVDQATRNSLTTEGIQRVAQLRLAVQELQKTKPDAVRELEEANGLEQGTLDIPTARPNMFEVRFANYPANQLRDSVLKTTVMNSAYNLVDLEPHLQQKTHRTCGCQGNLSRVFLPAFGRNDFLAIEGIDPDTDPATASVSEQILRSIPDYVAQRQALRGQQLDTRTSGLADAFDKIKDLRNLITRTGEDLREAGGRFREVGEQFRGINLGGGS